VGLAGEIVDGFAIEKGGELGADVGHHEPQGAALRVRAGAGFRGVGEGAGDGGDGAVHGADHVADGDLDGGSAQGVAAADAAFGGEEAGVAEGEEDLFEEFDGDGFLRGKLLNVPRARLPGHGDEGADGVFGFSGDAHGVGGVDEPPAATGRAAERMGG